MASVPTFGQIKATVAAEWSVTPREIDGQCRKRKLVLPRQMGWLIARQYTKLSCTLLGKLTGERDHSTVVYGCTKMLNRMEDDAGMHTAYLNCLDKLGLDPSMAKDITDTSLDQETSRDTVNV